ncbi:hypothetical protein G5714_015701 [Onychostoma macrolepis]|uniref:Uncharacterized protein n=1 Tax=Onychostoma macrolepis TaxID=369639 RepID=A0A7J6C6B1_9TELE|nr:hypothetical protein G5714_015701 [Onychostoma macrolepis]
MSSAANDPWVESIEESQQHRSQTGEAILDESNVSVRWSTRLATPHSPPPPPTSGKKNMQKRKNLEPTSTSATESRLLSPAQHPGFRKISSSPVWLPNTASTTVRLPGAEQQDDDIIPATFPWRTMGNTRVHWLSILSADSCNLSSVE